MAVGEPTGIMASPESTATEESKQPKPPNWPTPQRPSSPTQAATRPIEIALAERDTLKSQ